MSDGVRNVTTVKSPARRNLSAAAFNSRRPSDAPDGVSVDRLPNTRKPPPYAEFHLQRETQGLSMSMKDRHQIRDEHHDHCGPPDQHDPRDREPRNGECPSRSR